MIIEHRTYTVAHGKMRTYLERYERLGLPIQTRYLGRLAGVFVSEIGTLNQVIYIWCYDSLADREARRARMAGDPEWKAFVESNAGTFVHQEVMILNPAAFSPLK
ncbi:MAG: NIPSNAP family protein [Burkholderiales bacterium]|nr:NIPSNAP family protein [Burkholderiales bacterium]